MEDRGRALDDRLHGREVRDIAGHGLDPGVVESRSAGQTDVEQQEFADPLRNAGRSDDLSLLEDAPRQLLAEKARSAGNDHLHFVSVPFFIPESVHGWPSAVYVGAVAATRSDTRFA